MTAAVATTARRGALGAEATAAATGAPCTTGASCATGATEVPRLATGVPSLAVVADAAEVAVAAEMVGAAEVAVAAAAAALDRYAAAPAELRRAARPDAGPALLASVVAHHPLATVSAQAVLPLWLRDNGTPQRYPALFEAGTAGHWLALRSAAAAWPQLTGVADSAGSATRRLLTRSLLAAAPAVTPASPAATADPGTTTRPLPAPPAGDDDDEAFLLGWQHYDLISGPAGTALVGVALDEPDVTTPAVRHLAALCRHHDLRDLVVREYAGEKLRGWNTGRINTGLAHGVAGVVAALAAALDTARSTGGSGGPDAGVADALRTAAWWLVRHSVTTADGLVGWPVGVGLDGPDTRVSSHQRLSWCYGTPGVSWALWRAGHALDDAPLRDVALDAFGSYVARFDGARQLKGLGLCCGATGVALICDAVHRATALPAAAELRAHLLDQVHAGLDGLIDEAELSCELLAGSGGALAGLLALHGIGRHWLPAIGIPA